MEKIIKCKMNDDKSISVLLNEVEKFKIGADIFYESILW